MFSDLNPLGLETAILEIAIMLLGAFLIGFFTAWMIKRARHKTSDKGSGEEGAGLAAARTKNKELKLKLEQQQVSIKDLQARKAAAEKSAGDLSSEVKSLKEQLARKGKEAVQNLTPTPSGTQNISNPEWEKEKAELKEKIDKMEKTIGDNRSELGRMTSFRNEIKGLKEELAKAKADLAKDRLKPGQPIEGKELIETPVPNPEIEKLNKEMTRMRAQLATQEAAARRAEYRSKQLEKEHGGVTKERDRALEQLDDLQFKMDELQRQVGAMRTTTSKMDMNRPAGGGGDLIPLTSLKGLGNRSAEFLEKLGINTMERLAETDANTIQHIAKNLEKPVDVIQGWVDKAGESVA